MGQCSSKNSTDVRTNMTSKDYDQLEMLNGHWIFDRDENLDAFFKAADISEEMKAQFNDKPDVIFKREGNTLKEKSIFGPGNEYDVTFVLNEMKDWKEGDSFHIQVVPTLKDGKFVQEITPQLPKSAKAHYVATFAKGDVMTGEMGVAGEPPVAKRIYKRKAD